MSSPTPPQPPTPAPTTASVKDRAVTEGVYPRRWAVLAVLVTSLLIVVLDNTVLNVALKTIQEDLQATQSQLVWAINSYTLVFAALLFTWGVLGDRYGRKRILMIGMTLFGVASALTAFAATPEQLIIARAFMGVGGASVLPISLAIITVIFPPQERGKAIGVWAAAVGGAVALGPIVGGLLLEHFWWGSVFFINVPIVIIGVVGILLVVPETKNPHPGRLDPIGLVLSIVGLLAVVYGIQEAGWGKVSTYVWIGAGVLVLIGFVWFEARTTHPSLDLSLFKIRSFSVPLTGVSLAFAALQGSLLFLAFYYQIVRGWSPLQSGLLTLPFAVGQLLAAPRSAKMVARFGARRVIPFGLTLATLAMLGIARLTVDAPVWYLILVGFMFGFGLGNVIAPSTTRMTLAMPPARSGSGSAVQNTVRQVAAALGVAIISSIVANVYASNISATLAGTRLPQQLQEVASDSIGATFEVAAQVQSQAGAQAADALRQAGIDAFMPAFHVAAFTSVGLLVVALAIFLWRLPAQAEAVSWAAGAHQAPTLPKPAEDPEGDVPLGSAADARHQVHIVEEDPDHLAHVDEAPLEVAPVPSSPASAARED